MTPELHRMLSTTKQAIVETMNNGIANGKKPAETISKLIETQDIDTIKWLLAETVKSADWDGRYYTSTKDWANNLYIPVLHAERSTHYTLNEHPCHINSLVQAIIKS